MAGAKDEAVGVLAELAQVEGDEITASRDSLSAVIASHGASSDSKALAHALQTARTALDHYAKLAAARSRRAVVLEGLAKLGYSVTEGMETAWTESGRLVLQKPGLHGYAVELAGPGDAQRLQVRTVALGGDRSAARDLDAEHLWCGDFEKLKDGLAFEGTKMIVERAMGVGTVPLKVVQLADSTEVQGRPTASRAAAASGTKSAR